MLSQLGTVWSFINTLEPSNKVYKQTVAASKSTMMRSGFKGGEVARVASNWLQSIRNRWQRLWLRAHPKMSSIHWLEAGFSKEGQEMGASPFLVLWCTTVQLYTEGLAAVNCDGRTPAVPTSVYPRFSKNLSTKKKQCSKEMWANPCKAVQAKPKPKPPLQPAHWIT